MHIFNVEAVAALFQKKRTLYFDIKVGGITSILEKNKFGPISTLVLTSGDLIVRTPTLELSATVQLQGAQFYTDHLVLVSAATTDTMAAGHRSI
jgi:hypothetical protein